jgi:4-cresol dehydrogenase (hydroxylating) flavoprotein subunit
VPRGPNNSVEGGFQLATVQSPLPPLVSNGDFAKALKEFAAIVGQEWVLTSELDRNAYLDPFAPGDADKHATSTAVCPADVKQIQAIVKTANRYKVALAPIATGKNLAYGGPAPVAYGAVVLDLKRMNKILELNETMGYVLVEPGVNFFDLNEALVSRGSKFWLSGPAPGWGSVMGNALEHGLGYTPYGVHADMICGMEVVLPDGDIVRTGMGAVEGGEEWQIFKLGYGPVWDGMFTQSNFGIVSKMGLWLMPAPEAVVNVSVEIFDEQYVSNLIDALRPLRMNDTINATYTIENPQRQVINGMSITGHSRYELYKGKGAVPHEMFVEALKKKDMGLWKVSFNVFDREAGLNIRLKAIEEGMSKVPTSKMTTIWWRSGDKRPSWLRQDPVLTPLGIIEWAGGRGGHMNFAPVSAPSGERAMKLYNHIQKRYDEYGLDLYLGMLNCGLRSLIINAVTIFDRDNKDECERGVKLYKQLAIDGADMGFGDYRAHISFMDDAAEMYRFNNHALRRLNERVKDALDPNGIIAPGKQGIWPARLRGKRS